MNYKDYIEKILIRACFNKAPILKTSTQYDIIIPVYNGFVQLKACIESLLMFTSKQHRLYLYNDNSSDLRIKPFLDDLNLKHKHISIIHNNKNLGYLKNSNQALNKSKKDVVLLNADTVVTANWLKEMSLIAQDEKVGIVCPLSDNATILSLNKIAMHNITKLSSFSGQWYSLPTAVGSCMLIKRKIINDFGSFDEYYDPGYGEECDYSLRIRTKGYNIACSIASFVYHYGSASFKEDSKLLKEQHQKLLDLRWPHYNREVQSFIENNPIASIEEYLFNIKTKNNVLHVVHGLKNKGGVELFTSDLLNTLDKNTHNTVIVPYDNRNTKLTPKIYFLNKNTRVIHYKYEEQETHNQIGDSQADLYNKNWDTLFAKHLLYGNYKLVHFHSLVNSGSLIKPLICNYLNIPYILSFHDHFPVCFNFYLLKNNNSQNCKKSTCSEADQECVKCLDNITNFKSIGTKEYIKQRNIIWLEIVKYANKIIVPSIYLRKLYLEKFKFLPTNKIIQVEPYFYPKIKPTIKKSCSQKLCIAFLGSFSNQKGAQVFLDTYKKLNHYSIQWKIIGNIQPRYSKFLFENRNSILQEGLYERDELPKLLNDVDLIIIPSIAPETYSITLTEAWLYGIPVIASDIAALHYRISHNINGQLFPCKDVEFLVKLIKEHIADQSTLLKIRSHLSTVDYPKISSSQIIQETYSQYLNKEVKQKHVKHPYSNRNILPTPFASSYSKMESWLYSNMTLEADLDWANPKNVKVIIVGDNKSLCTQSKESCLEYLSISDVYMPYFEDNFNLDVLSGTLCIIQQGHVLNDNFGNWTQNFKYSNKDISLADYALINNNKKIYAPQFLTGFDVFSFNRHKNRIGVILLNLDTKNVTLIKKSHELINNQHPFYTLIDMLISDNKVDQIYYFPYLSYLYNDVKWVSHWKLDIANELTQNNANIKSISIVLVTCKDEKDIDLYVSNILKQKNVLIESIHIFCPSFKAFKTTNKIHKHYIDFSESEKFINPIIDQTRSKFVCFLSDNVYIKNPILLSRLTTYIDTHNLQALSPISNQNKDFLIADKLGKGRISGLGVLRDIRFESHDWPYLSLLLDRDCFLISKKVWNKTNHSFKINSFFSSHILSSQIVSKGYLIGLVTIEGIYKYNLPSYSRIKQLDSLGLQRKKTISSNKSFFYSAENYQPISYDSQFSCDLDNNFGAFKAPKNLPRVLAYSNNNGASGFYRIKAPISALAAQNTISANFLPDSRFNITATCFEINKQNPDVLLLHNFLNDEQLSALKLYKENLKIPIILSLDDLLTEIPAYNSFSVSNPNDIQKRIKKALSFVDRLIVTNDYLADKFSHFHDCIVVIRNMLPKEIWKIPASNKKINKKIRVGWAGAQQHQGDLDWLKPIIMATKQTVQWVFYGYLPKCLNIDGIEFHKNTPLAKYHITLNSLNLDIAIAPLAHNSFNKAKSNLKLIEYGALGLPTICSDIGNYKNSPAIKLDNNPLIWINKINELVNNLEMRSKLSHNMRSWVESEYFLEDHLNLWKSSLYLKEALINRKKPKLT